jgi:HEAT repeat protein
VKLEKDLETALFGVAERCDKVLLDIGKSAARKFAEEQLGFSTIHGFARADDPAVRRKALYLLSLWDSSLVVSILADALLNDSSRVVRHEAAFLLATLRLQEAVEPLATALAHDADELVRHEAAEALGDLGFESAALSLRVALQDSSAMVRETAAIALRQLGCS